MSHLLYLNVKLNNIGVNDIYKSIHKPNLMSLDTKIAKIQVPQNCKGVELEIVTKRIHETTEIL